MCCNTKKKNCIATVEQGQGWTVLQYSGQPSHDTVGVGQQARAQGRAGRVGRRRGAGLGVAGVAHGRQGARQGRAAGKARGRGERGRQAQARGRRAGAGRSRRAGSARRKRPRRAGWLRAVHSVHSACFRFGSTRYFS